jgi:hypothetical protein
MKIKTSTLSGTAGAFFDFVSLRSECSRFVVEGASHKTSQAVEKVLTSVGNKREIIY